MGTKTISVKAEAYNRLRNARRYPEESFSEVVLRATWPEDTVTSGELLARWRAAGPVLTKDEWARIADLKQHDQPPGDKWAAR